MRKGRRTGRPEPRDYVSVETSVFKVTVAFELTSVDYEELEAHGLSLEALEAEISHLKGVRGVEGDLAFGPVIYVDLRIKAPLVGANELRMELPVVAQIKDLIRAAVRGSREARA